MRCFLSLLFLVGAAFSQPEPVYRAEGFVGTRTLIPGSTHTIRVPHGWFLEVPYTVVGPDRVSAPGHTFSNGQTVRAFTTGVHPYPVTSARVLVVCDISGDTFRLTYQPNTCANSYRLTFTSPGSGIHTIGARVRGSHIFLGEVEGLPAGVTAAVGCGTSGNCFTRSGRRFDWQGNSSFLRIELSVDPSAPPASFVLQFWVEAPDGIRTVQVPLEIAPVPELYLRQPSTFSADLLRWESNMVRLARRWCNPDNPTERMSFGVGTQVWYYDGAQVYFDVAAYTGDARWNGCGLNIASQYRDYVRNNNGRIPGYRVFTAGLSSAYRMTGDSTFLDAVRLLATNSLYAEANLVTDDWIRELSYVLRAMVDYERLTGIRSPHMERAVVNLIGMFDQLFVSETYTYHQLFMDGLGMRALIEYWELTKDPRIPPAIQVALDWIWEKGRDPVTGRLYINPDPVGPKCDWGCRGTSPPNSELILLISPAYAWFWAVTGNDLYRHRADSLFARAFDTDISYSGKIFSQNYTWSFAQVFWRTQP